jgi:hypothetical protein
MAKQLLTRNAKIKKMFPYTVNFGMTALKSCPMAHLCKDLCYANKGAYIWPVVKAAYEARFNASKEANFTELIVKELNSRKKVKQVRIHDSGDFYSDQYLDKWLKVMQERPDMHFYAYTKCVKRLKSREVPKNFTVIYSLGGLEDYLVDCTKDRHSKIFDTLDQLLDAGYIDASKDDTIAYNPYNNKIGLVKH